MMRSNTTNATAPMIIHLLFRLGCAVEGALCEATPNIHIDKSCKTPNVIIVSI